MSSYLSRPRTMEQATQESNAALKMADVPSNMFQGMLSEGPQGASKALLEGKEYGLKDLTGKEHGIVAETAYEVATDPAMLFGPVKTMFKGLGRVIKDPSKAYGDITSSLSNFIDGYYGSSSGSKGAAVVSWLPTQLKNMVSTISPDGLKTLEEFGMTKPMVDMAAKFLAASKAGDKKALKKAYAQVQHGAYMMHRAGVSPADMPPLYQRMIDSMSLDGQGFMPLSKETYLDEIKNIPYATKKGMSVGPADPTVASKLFESAQNAWGLSSGKTKAGMPVDMIIRRPDVMLGDFASDVSKSGMSTMLSKVFSGGVFDSADDLKKALDKQLMSAKGSRAGVGRVVDTRTAEEIAAGKTKTSVVDSETGVVSKVSPYKVTNIKVADDGVYFSYRGSQVEKAGKKANELASRSYLEGGINMQVHVDKKGNVTAVTSDNYDFYEDKIKVTEKLLPKGILGVTPPIRVNILRRRTGDQIVNAPQGAETFGKDQLEAIAAQRATPDIAGNVAYGVLGGRAAQGMLFSDEEQ
jgi:hypothetical protein